MKARPGSRILIRGHRQGEPDRDCEVIEVRGPDDEGPYVVRWGDSGHETLLFPGPDALVVEPEAVGSASGSAGRPAQGGSR